MENFIIEKNIELPDRGRKSKYPFKSMVVGDSFIYDKEYTNDNMRKLCAAGQNFCRHSKDSKSWKFTVRKVKDNKIRIWRIK